MACSNQHLTSKGLHRLVRTELKKERFPPCKRSHISWEDCCMSGLAIYGLKLSSLLEFDQARHENSALKKNLEKLYGIENIPSDTCMRERLDQVSPAELRKPFKKIWSHLQRSNILKTYQYFEGHYVLSIDGTGQYASNKISCKNCCIKQHRNGVESYYHHMLGAVLVHPDKKVVIPLAPEPIVRGDGAKKNDCERNAAKRLLHDFRREHPHLKVIVVEDGLGSNYPHLSQLDCLNMKYVIGVKPGDHKSLFDWIKYAQGESHVYTDIKGAKHSFTYYTDVPLSNKHENYRVQVIEYIEENPNGKRQKFSWVTNIKVDKENVYKLMRAGRSRWRIENETFNTLKNQGYNFEHNYGHGYEHLCSVMTMLLMLAFLIDQVRMLSEKIYQKAREVSRTWRKFFERKRTLFELIVWDSWDHLHEVMARQKPFPSG